jgi:hypothetical protein
MSEDPVMKSNNFEDLKVYPSGNRLVVYVPGGRGEELRVHLASHAIAATVSKLTGSRERLEVGPDADAETLQAILDHWER